MNRVHQSIGNSAHAPDEPAPGALLIGPNLALDHICQMGALPSTPGVVRADSSFVSAGGKGVNVCRALTLVGTGAKVVGISAGELGLVVERLAASEGIRLVTERVAGESRIASIFVSPQLQQSLVVNTPGPPTTLHDWTRFTNRVLETMRREGPNLVAVCGSLPMGVPPDGYNRILQAARSQGAFTVVDASGDVLGAALETKPDLVKVNQVEASQLLDPSKSATSLEDAARGLRRAGALQAIVTGGRMGAVVVGYSSVIRGVVPRVESASATGAGDAFLAGYVSSILSGVTGEEALVNALSVGTASVGTDFPAYFDPATLDAIRSQVEISVLHDG